ncbi:MAG: sterol desaturase family protein [Myxococcaceae bacterium]|nr:sterol desaturase family protein [Myxococcaceae bacterium]MCI0671062.1 sterol desaturase family protein [Myxococcaceae bacterium]
MKDLIILAAVPAFFLLIFVELFIGWRRGFNTYRVNDSVSSLSAGILSQASGVFPAALGFGFYTLAYKHLSLFALPKDAWWVWVLALVGYDFCYYWAHRMGHEVNLMWAAHVVHHSSEEYNLSTALRQTSTGFLCGWLFYMPLAIIGVPPFVHAIAGSINLLYQYWIHTKQIGRLGWFDRWFASPSNHRVHHGQNDYCLDRNYGAMFMVWDRLFGTFVDERKDEEIVYGIRGALKSWNPVWTNFHFYRDMWRDCVLADNWKDRVKVWFAHPGWRPEAAERKAPKPTYDITRFQKFDPPAPGPLVWYAFGQFVLGFPLAVHCLWVQSKAPLAVSASYFGVLVLTLWTVGGLMENRPFFVKLEFVRLALLAVGVAVSGSWFGGITLSGATLALALAPLVASAMWLVLVTRRSDAPLAPVT